MNRNKKILIVVDQPGWAFDKIATNLKVTIKNWKVDILYGKNNDYKDLFNASHDLLLFLPDFRIDVLAREHSFPKNRILLAVRSDVFRRGIKGYNAEFLNKNVGAILCSNQLLFARTRQLHDKVYLVPGGVDTKKFTPKPFIRFIHPVVGWAGSRDNFGKKLRGLDLIEEACGLLKWKFNPAYREDRWRTEDEMVKYYQDEIDIYVDADIRAGRQNGLLEAASCGKMVVGVENCGICNQLIKNDYNGILVHRSINGIMEGLRCVMPYHGDNMRKTVEEEWSWEVQAKLFEDIFDEVAHV